MKKHLWIIWLLPIVWFVWYEWKDLAEFFKFSWTGIIALASLGIAWFSYMKHHEK